MTKIPKKNPSEENEAPETAVAPEPSDQLEAPTDEPAEIEGSGSKDIDKLLDGTKVLWCEQVRLRPPGSDAYGPRHEALLSRNIPGVTDMAYVVSSGAVIVFGPLTDAGRSVRVFNDVLHVKLLPGGKREKDKGGRPRKEG